MKRRTFLGTITAAALAACSRDTTDATPDTPTSPTGAGTTDAGSTAPTTTSSTSTTSASVDPLEAPAVDLPDDAFGLGVASGDPTSDSVVLWTRLDRVPPDLVAPIVWEVAGDDDFTELVATGLVEATGATGHAVRVIVDQLSPFATYHYRFRAGSLVSPVGRTRVLPPTGSIETVRIAVSSCQDVDRGAYAAHRDLAASGPLTCVLWLGDFIYRRGTTLDDFRATYAEYRRDPLLQAGQALCPWIVIPDDNEVANDYDASVDPSVRAAAYRAWWENQPTRLPEPSETGADFRFHRTVDVGSAARIILTDSRQYADDSTLYGAEQLAFIENAMQHDAARTIVASSVLMSGLRGTDDVLLPYTLDAHPEERARIADALATAPDPLIVSGDLHTGMVLDFSADPSDPDAAVVATELMAPAISSTFPEEFAPFAPFLPLVNPHIRHVDTDNGWLLLEMTPDPESGGWRTSAEFRTVADVSDPASTVSATHRIDV